MSRDSVDRDPVSVFSALPEELAPGHDRLTRILETYGSVIVAYSGGVDSGLLAFVANRVLGARALPVLGVSDSLPRREEEAAAEFLESHGIGYERIGTDEMKRAGYRKNGPDRCYFCKTELFSKLRDLAARRGFAYVAYGANLDDQGDYRPGGLAAREKNVVAPLLEAGLSKSQIRGIARALGLALWDKPASPCLASRVPYFQEVTREKLAQIEEAEYVLKDLGFAVCRVRHQGDTARIEVPRVDHGRLLETAVWARVESGLRSLGFRRVTADPEGFRSGRLNDALRSLPENSSEEGGSRE